jgi:hypothetical protein
MKILVDFTGYHLNHFSECRLMGIGADVFSKSEKPDKNMQKLLILVMFFERFEKKFFVNAESWF